MFLSSPPRQKGDKGPFDPQTLEAWGWRLRTYVRYVRKYVRTNVTCTCVHAYILTHVLYVGGQALKYGFLRYIGDVTAAKRILKGTNPAKFQYPGLQY